MSLDLTFKAGEVSNEIISWTFPGGERNIRFIPVRSIFPPENAFIECRYENSDDLIDLILLVNAIRQYYGNIPIELDIPYFPFARQDRVMEPGEPNAAQAIAQVLVSLNFTKITCLDAHSDVLPALFPPGLLNVVPQWKLHSHLNAYTPGLLVSPDAGASKKVHLLGKHLYWPVFEASKRRNTLTGDIEASVFNPDFDVNKYEVIYIVDDICDGGRTFVELAKAIKAHGFTGSLVLSVTHGIFSKGLEPLEVFDKVHAVNNMSKYNLNKFNSRNI